MAFVIGLDRYFPKAFGAVHPRWHTPYVAILVQATLATIFLLLSVLGKGTNVEDVYLILLDTQILIYFIPYLYLFIVFLIHRRHGENSSEVVLAPGGSIGAMAHRLERYDRDFVCDDYRDDSSAGYGKLSAVSVKSYWRRARIHSDRRIDLLVRAIEEK